MAVVEARKMRDKIMTTAIKALRSDEGVGIWRVWRTE